MNTIEALAMVIAEQREQIDQLEQAEDIYRNKAARYQTQFEMCEHALNETQAALRLCGAEVSDLKSKLLEYDDGYQ